MPLASCCTSLLTGQTPFTRQEIQAAPLAEIRRLIREVEPPSPSRRLLQSTVDLAGIATRRGTDPRKLVAAVRGDLDWIVQKAIDKDRTRRYDTANGLALDVRQSLEGKTVLAAPPSGAYRLRKFVTRHKAPVAAAGLVGLALVLGLAGTLWQASVATRQRDAAQREAANAAAVTDFVVESLDPMQGDGQDMSVADAMRQAAPRLDSGGLQPETVAVIRRTIAEVLNRNGKSNEALPLAEQSLALERRFHSTDDPHVADSLSILGLIKLGLKRFAEAQPILEESLAMLRRLGDDDFLIQNALSYLSFVHEAQGHLVEAESMAVELLERMERHVHSDDQSTAVQLNNVSRIQLARGNAPDAERTAMRALTMGRQIFKGDHRTIGSSLQRLAEAEAALRRWDGALDHARQGAEMAARLAPSGDAARKTADSLLDTITKQAAQVGVRR